MGVTALVSRRREPLVVRISATVGPPPMISASSVGIEATDGYQRPSCMSGWRVHVSVRQSKTWVRRKPWSALSALPPATKTLPLASWTKPAQKMFEPATSTRLDVFVTGS